MANRTDTPAAKWREEGQPDPHDGKYDCMRSELTLGEFIDDELANEVFLKADQMPSVEDLIAGNAKPPIIYLTAAKERIRWLSRQLHREPELVFAWQFEGRDIMVTPEAKRLIDHLNGEIKYLRGEGRPCG